MRTYATITWDKAGKPTVVHGPDVPHEVQKATYKKLATGTKDGNDKLTEVQLCILQKAKGRKWLTSEQVKANDKAMAEQEKAVQELEKKSKK